MRRLVGLLVTLVVFALIAAGSAWSAAIEVEAKKIKEDEVPTVDGKVDKVWDTVRAKDIRIAEGKIGKIDVKMKVLYTDTDIFFLFQWPDKTESLGRYYGFDGKAWKKAPGDEDRLALMWDINNSVKKFSERGCAALCHQKGKEVFQSTDGPAEKTDLWHWKAQRTNPMGYADDMYLSHELRGGARTAQQGDAKTAGGYEENWDTAANHPKYTFREGASVGPVLLKKDAVAIKDYGQLKSGDRLPQEVLEKPQGSLGDIEAKGVWERGRWTVEFKRARATIDKEHDVQFVGEGPYYLGMAVHDDTGSDDHSHTGKTAIQLRLK